VADKLPWMPFFGSDFYNDEAVRLMSLEEEALYMRLLWWQWREGSLPADPADVQRLAGHPPGDRLLMLFPVTRNADGRRRNPRLEEVRQEQLAKVRKRSKAGKLGRQKQLATRAQAGQSPGNRRARAGQTPGESEAESESKKTWLTPFADAWQDRCGNPPHGRLAKVLAPLAKQLGEPDALSRWSRYLADNEPRYCSPERFAATHAAYAGPETLEMTDDIGQMRLHTKRDGWWGYEDGGQWVRTIEVTKVSA
jgi:hypothetical protein